MEKTIKIGKKEVLMKATASTPKKYRNEFNQDLIIELQKLYAHVDTETGTFIGEVNLDVIENLAYIMAKQGNGEIENIDDWLDQFEVTDVYKAIPDILRVWKESETSMSTPSNESQEEN